MRNLSLICAVANCFHQINSCQFDEIWAKYRILASTILSGITFCSEEIKYANFLWLFTRYMYSGS